MIAACAVLHGGGAHAQSGSAAAIFEKYNLLGTFALDCSKPASQNNGYFVNRALDAGRVQRDFMQSPTARAWYVIVDQARETGPNQIFLSGTRDNGQPTDGTWRVGPKRVQQWEATLNGRKVIADGKAVNTGRALPPLNKCD
jgi:hypothetical protein